MWAAPLLLPFTTREGCRGCQEALVPLPGFSVPFPCGEVHHCWGGKGKPWVTWGWTWPLQPLLSCKGWG